MILLGWEIGTGKRVEIPETGHLAWFGQTQLSGKTTALEAIAFRGHLKAIAFITKQGEGGFLTGRMIPPYFSEPTNDEEQPLWLWVKAILEANQQRRMVIEESFIIRACEEPHHAETLADVHANVKVLLRGEKRIVDRTRKGKNLAIGSKEQWIRKPATALANSMYTNLNAYFNIVMPQLARLPYTKKLEIGPGLNVMDLRDYSMQTQALVIRSVAEWIYQRERNCRMILPECQDFIRQGKNSPVKMAAETYIRKGGANGNFMWFDSQDMAVVDKFALKACSIVGIGVQTEINEIDRTLASLFSPGLKSIDIAQLKIGEFFVRTSEARVAKCYVQPAWMESELHAQAIAKGEESVAGARQMLRAFKHSRKPHQLLQIQTLEPPNAEGLYDQQPDNDFGIRVYESRDVCATQRHRGRSRNDGDDETGKGQEEKTKNLNKELSDHEKPGRSDIEPDRLDHRSEKGRDLDEDISGADSRAESAEVSETMWQEKYEALKAEHKTLIEAHDALAAEVRRLRDLVSNRGTVEHGVAIPRANAGNGSALSETQEQIYRYVIKRAQDDPGVLELLLRKPELRVKLERQIIEMDDSTIIGRIARLIHDGYFKQSRNGPTVQKELKRRGCDQPTTNLYKPLNRLTEMGFLTLEADGFQEIPEMKVSIAKA